MSGGVLRDPVGTVDREGKKRALERAPFFCSETSIETRLSFYSSTLLVHHADGFLGAGVDAGFAIDAFLGVHEGMPIHHRNDFGGAGIDTIFAGGAFGFVDKSGHFVSSRGSFQFAERIGGVIAKIVNETRVSTRT